MSLITKISDNTEYGDFWVQDRVVYWVFKLLQYYTPVMTYLNKQAQDYDKKFYGLLMSISQCIAFWITVKRFETIRFKQKVVMAIVEVFSFADAELLYYLSLTNTNETYLAFVLAVIRKLETWFREDSNTRLSTLLIFKYQNNSTLDWHHKIPVIHSIPAAISNWRIIQPYTQVCHI